MATYKASPKAIARQVIEGNQDIFDLAQSDDTKRETLESAIMLGIAAYLDPSNLKPEGEVDETFGDISNERQWDWGTELDVLWSFIEEKGLYAEVVAHARKCAESGEY